MAFTAWQVSELEDAEVACLLPRADANGAAGGRPTRNAQQRDKLVAALVADAETAGDYELLEADLAPSLAVRVHRWRLQRITVCCTGYTAAAESRQQAAAAASIVCCCYLAAVPAM
jgi:hypothetical protein